MDASKDKTPCRTPAEGRDGVTNIPTWKYDALSAVISDIVTAAGPEGLPFSQLKSAVGERLDGDVKDRLGSLGWHVTTVKLEMEVRGDLARLPGAPQRIIVPGLGS